LTGRLCPTTVQQPLWLPGSVLRNRLKARRNCGHSGQRHCSGIARLRGIGRTDLKISLLGHVIQALCLRIQRCDGHCNIRSRSCDAAMDASAMVTANELTSA
jgi:hypothetical protein